MSIIEIKTMTKNKIIINRTVKNKNFLKSLKMLKKLVS